MSCSASFAGLINYLSQIGKYNLHRTAEPSCNVPPGVSGPDPDGDSGGCNPLFSNRRGSIIYILLEKRKLVML